jgi:hypothetical protein
LINQSKRSQPQQRSQQARPRLFGKQYLTPRTRKRTLPQPGVSVGHDGGISGGLLLLRHARRMIVPAAAAHTQQQLRTSEQVAVGTGAVEARAATFVRAVQAAERQS